MPAFISELRRRNVLRIATAYALVAWILIEAGSVLLPTFGAPEWFFKAYVIVVVAGFVLALIMAWAFEITPDGVRLERDIDRSDYEKPASGSKNYLIIGLLAVALGISITFNITGMRGDPIDFGESQHYDSIAVLPFTSRSSLEENRFFADGIHDDILTRLAEINSLRVISRTSVNEYRDTTRNLRQIGEDLDVSAIVEGAVQRSGDQVRITVQLIDAATDEHIWARTYDEILSIESMFEVQTEISSQIASALQAALTPAQEIRLAAIPTDNLEAYAEYVAGRENLLQRSFTSLVAAREQFEHAIKLDPEYALAHVALAETVLITVANHKSIAPAAAFSVASVHLDAALQIDPQLAQIYAARGLLEMMRWEGTRTGTGNLAAATSFEKALDLNPNLADAYVWFASLRQSEGEIGESIDLLTTALTIDPLARIPYVNLPSFLAMEGQTERTTELLLHAVRIFPEWATPYNYLSNHLQKLGRPDEAVAWGLMEATLNQDPMAGGSLIGIYQDFGDEQRIDEFFAAFPADHPLYPVGQSYRHFLNREYGAAFAELESLMGEIDVQQEITLPLLVGAAILDGDYDHAYEYLMKSNPKLNEDSATTVDRFNIRSAVLLAYVEQKRHNPEAAAHLLRQAETIVRDLPRLGMAGYGIRDVQILTLLGRHNEAIEALTQAVDEGFVSSQSYDGWPVDEDPIIEPIRSDPRFGVLMKRIDLRLEEMRLNVDQARRSGDWSALLAKARST